MNRIVRGFIPLALVAVSANPAASTISGGGGKKTDCYVELTGITATSEFLRKPQVECTDGDPACDADGIADDRCTFVFAVCEFNVDPSLPLCRPESIVHFHRPFLAPSIVRRLSVLHLPRPGATSTTCAPDSRVVVPLKHGRPRRALVMLIGSAKRPRRDVDVFYLRCNPSPRSPCPPNPAGGPRELDTVEAASGGDLDNGTTGISHNFPIPQGATLKYCLSDCDGASQPVCQATGPTGKGSLNGETFGPPLPLFSSNVPVCVVNRFADPVNKAVVNVQTGIFDATTTPVHLKSDVYLTNSPPKDVCPICTGSSIGATGTCDSGPNQGQSCTVEGIVIVNNPPAVVNKKYTLSSSCPPDPAQFKATLDITLPLTNDPAKPSTLAANAAGSFPCPGQTQHDECGGTPCNVDCSGTKPLRGGLNQVCCASDGTTPCFPTSPASGSQPIVRTGAASPPTPSWVPNQTTSATAANNVLAATFCEAATGSSIIDTTAGLPGPGALLLSGTATFVGNR